MPWPPDLWSLGREEEIRRRCQFIETDVAEAMRLQEYGYLERLVVVYQHGDLQGRVASLLNGGDPS